MLLKLLDTLFHVFRTHFFDRFLIETLSVIGGESQFHFCSTHFIRLNCWSYTVLGIVLLLRKFESNYYVINIGIYINHKIIGTSKTTNPDALSILVKNKWH